VRELDLRNTESNYLRTQLGAVAEPMELIGRGQLGQLQQLIQANERAAAVVKRAV